MLELWQTEWCPASHRVRGIDYVTHQVPVEREERTLLVERTGADTIPVLVTEDGTALVGEDAISAYLDTHVQAPHEAEEAHRLKAEKARRRYLEEECECSQPTTP
jgi:glutathione S-transferase